MVHSQTIETYGPQPNSRNIWSSRLADSFVCAGSGSHTTTYVLFIPLQIRLRNANAAITNQYYFSITKVNVSVCQQATPNASDLKTIISIDSFTQCLLYHATTSRDFPLRPLKSTLIILYTTDLHVCATGGCLCACTCVAYVCLCACACVYV